MPRPHSKAAAPEYAYMRERDTTYQDACKLVDELLEDARAFIPDPRATVFRCKLRKLQRWLTEGR
jgi:hypothetical protein